MSTIEHILIIVMENKYLNKNLTGKNSRVAQLSNVKKRGGNFLFLFFLFGALFLSKRLQIFTDFTDFYRI